MKFTDYSDYFSTYFFIFDGEKLIASPVHFLFPYSCLRPSSFQVKKTWGATLTTLQDMTVLDDCDVSQSFTHSPSSESVKSSVSDGYLNKPSLAKRRANQQETELFYFNVRASRPQMGRGLHPWTHPDCIRPPVGRVMN